MNNFKLIDKLLETEKLVFCSTGAHDQIDIDDLNKKYSKKEFCTYALCIKLSTRRI